MRTVNIAKDMLEIVGELGAEKATFREAFPILKSRHKRIKFKQNSCRNAFLTARKTWMAAPADGTHKRNGHQVQLEQVASLAANPICDASEVLELAGKEANPTIVYVILSARRLIKACGDGATAKAVIDAIG